MSSRTPRKVLDSEATSIELPFPGRLRGPELHDYLAQAAHAMTALRRLRHPLIQCVTGHFYTGASLVQVSDWFDGRTLEDFVATERLSLDDKILLMMRVCDALIYCHEQNVFHRNIHPRNVLIGQRCGDLQLTGFECVKDSQQGRTALASEMNKRDKRLVPPEELGEGPIENFRLYDIFRIMEDGRWPFTSTHEYQNGDCSLRFTNGDDPRCASLHEMITGMLSISPQQRPNVMQRILDSLQLLA